MLPSSVSSVNGDTTDAATASTIAVTGISVVSLLPLWLAIASDMMVKVSEDPYQSQCHHNQVELTLF